MRLPRFSSYNFILLLYDESFGVKFYGEVLEDMKVGTKNLI